MSEQKQTLGIDMYTRLDMTSKEDLLLRDTITDVKELCSISQRTTFWSEPAERLIRFVTDYDGGRLCPDRCGAYEPIRLKFDRNNITEPIRWVSQVGSAVLLKKNRPLPYLAQFENKRHMLLWEGEGKKRTLLARRPDPLFLTKVDFWIDMKVLKVVSPEYLRQFFVDLFLVSEGDFGFMTLEKDQKNKNYLITQERLGQCMRYVGRDLEKCLPGVYWINIFGRHYVDWFGRERFASVPCFRREELKDGSVLVQSAEDMHYFETEEAVSAEKIIDHLGRDAFFDMTQPERQCRVPDFSKW